MKEFKTNIIYQEIDILKAWRKILWESAFKGTTAFLVNLLGGIFAMPEDLARDRQYISNELYEEIMREYEMTMYLLHKCLINVSNRNLLSSDGEKVSKIKDLIIMIERRQKEIGNIDSIIKSLRAEDPSNRMTLDGLGLSEQHISEILKAGFTVESVLDVVPEMEKQM